MAFLLRCWGLGQRCLGFYIVGLRSFVVLLGYYLTSFSLYSLELVVQLNSTALRKYFVLPITFGWWHGSIWFKWPYSVILLVNSCYFTILVCYCLSFSWFILSMILCMFMQLLRCSRGTVISSWHGLRCCIHKPKNFQKAKWSMSLVDHFLPVLRFSTFLLLPS